MKQLVALARQGGENAVRALIKRNNQRLFRVARAVMRNDAEAEDVVQETYVLAFTKLDTFRGDSQFSTWLTRIALNEALGRVRRRRPTAELAELDVSDLGPRRGSDHVSDLVAAGRRLRACPQAGPRVPRKGRR